MGLKVNMKDSIEHNLLKMSSLEWPHVGPGCGVIGLTSGGPRQQGSALSKL